MITRIAHIPQKIEATIQLPSSKSISNRALLLCALSGPGGSIERLATCDDTYVMWRALQQRPKVVDVMAAGTAMRFLTAFFAVCDGDEEHVMTGTERMRQRPIGVLVDALRQLGAKIDYVEQEGFPPLRVKGGKLKGGHLSLPGNVSSQYVSALLMVAPLMEEGLTLELTGEVVSRPYIDMTLSMMRTYGTSAFWLDDHTLQVHKVTYKDDVIFPVESDWSAASYWYEIMALTPAHSGSKLVLPWLRETSLQGDCTVHKFFEPLGVTSTFDATHGLVTLTRNANVEGSVDQMFELDLTNQPDLAQTMVVTCALLRRPFRFTGLQSLRIKETDRIAALQTELKKLGVTLNVEGDEAVYVTHYDEAAPQWNGEPIATYHDHRMAMAFAPASMRCPGLEIANPEVVSKSYPRFWEDLESLGEGGNNYLSIKC